MKKLWILTTTLTMAFFILNPVLSQEKYAVIITGDYAATNGTWAVANGVTDNSPMEEFWNELTGVPHTHHPTVAGIWF
ncbi:MAG: hypothetical protein ACNA7V_10265 [Bacteroidales bacterium]